MCFCEHVFSPKTFSVCVSVCVFWITRSRCLMLIVNTSNHKQLVRTTASLSLCVAVGGKSVCMCDVLCLEHSIILLRVPLTRQTVGVWENTIVQHTAS